jgi:PAS domain S-box-containing protein
MTEIAQRIAATISAAGGEWFRQMAEAASDLIAVLDTRGRQVYANPALTRLLGIRAALIGAEFFRDVHPEDRERIEKMFAQTLADGIGRRAEHRFLLPGGEVRYVESQGNTIPGPDGRVKLVVVVSRDVTERRRMKDELRARDVQLQEAQVAANLGSWEWDVRTDRIWWSDQLRRIFGFDDGYQPTLGSFLESVHPEERETMAEASRIAFENGRVYDKPFRILRPDGTVRTVISSGRMERDDDNQPLRLLGILVDITDKTWIERRAHSATERLRAVSRRLVEVQETERRTLARELHDRVGQNLTALGLNLRVITGELATSSGREVAAHLEDCMDLVESTVDAMRGVVGELRPHVLDDYGLLAALRSHASVYSARTGIRVAIGGEDVHGRIPKDVEVALFRIAQEALNNVAKHSRATVVEVSLSGGAGRATLALNDDGVGFDPGRTVAADKKQGWGLMIMRERAESVGARFDLQATPGAGVRVLVDYGA